MSFKVICIDNKQRRIPELNTLVEGEIYTVIATGPKLNGYYGYRLKEIESSGANGMYCSDRFIPLSAIDERELLEQRQTQLA